MSAIIFRRKFKQVLIAAMVLAAIVSAFVVGDGMQEITAQEYRLLRTVMKEGNLAERQEIAERMKDGRVNKWEYAAVVHTLWSGNAPSLRMSATNVAEERLVLLAMVRQVVLTR